MGLIEKYGFGIQRIINLFLEAGLPAPVFQNQSNGFLVTIYSSTENKTFDNTNEGLNTVYKIILENGGIQAKQISTKLNERPIKTIEKQIKELIQKEMIERRGSRKTGGY
jgi:ATP-dependent DNA helicase RecG